VNKEIRKKIIDMVYKAGDGHIPSGLCIVEILNVLYRDILKYDPKNPKWEGRDYFILSKGHGSDGFYVILEKYGFLTQKDLDTFTKYDSKLGGLADRTKVPGVEAAGGSLGHGFPVSLGMSLGLRIQGKSNRVFVLIGDAECNEGAVWETVLLAAHHRLGRLYCIVDDNKSSSQILEMGSISEKFRAFGWNAYDVDGHNEEALLDVFKKLPNEAYGKPTAIIAHTIKGKGAKMLEGHGVWHSKAPNTEEYAQIMEQLED